MASRATRSSANAHRRPEARRGDEAPTPHHLAPSPRVPPYQSSRIPTCACRAAYDAVGTPNEGTATPAVVNCVPPKDSTLFQLNRLNTSADTLTFVPPFA